MWVFCTYFTTGLGKLGTPCYSEEFVSLSDISVDLRFVSQRNLVASDYGNKIVHKPSFGEGGYFL